MHPFHGRPQPSQQQLRSAAATSRSPRGPAAGSQIDAAEIICAGGDIVTVNDSQPTAEALAVKGDRILAVGARADVERAHKGARRRWSIADLVILDRNPLKVEPMAIREVKVVETINEAKTICRAQ